MGRGATQVWVPGLSLHCRVMGNQRQTGGSRRNPNRASPKATPSLGAHFERARGVFWAQIGRRLGVDWAAFGRPAWFPARSERDRSAIGIAAVGRRSAWRGLAAALPRLGLARPGRAPARPAPVFARFFSGGSKGLLACLRACELASLRVCEPVSLRAGEPASLRV